MTVLSGAKDLSKLGMNVIGIPVQLIMISPVPTIPMNYDTAMNTVLDAIDKIRDTSYSHERCSVLEVMGRMQLDAGAE